jgi:hypothetical protein
VDGARTLQRADEGTVGLRLCDLGGASLDPAPSVTGAVDRLKRMGLLATTVSSEDQRVREVRLTRSGRERVAQVLVGSAERGSRGCSPASKRAESCAGSSTVSRSISKRWSIRARRPTARTTSQSGANDMKSILGIGLAFLLAGGGFAGWHWYRAAPPTRRRCGPRRRARRPDRHRRDRDGRARGGDRRGRESPARSTPSATTRRAA